MRELGATYHDVDARASKLWFGDGVEAIFVVAVLQTLWHMRGLQSKPQTFFFSIADGRHSITAKRQIALEQGNGGFSPTFIL